MSNVFRLELDRAQLFCSFGCHLVNPLESFRKELNDPEVFFLIDWEENIFAVPALQDLDQLREALEKALE